MPVTAYVLEIETLISTPASPFPMWDAAPAGISPSVSLALASFSVGREARSIPNPGPAYLGAQWQDAYYPRLVFSQGAIDVGLVSSPVYISIGFWNASDVPLTVSSIIADGADGVSVSGLALPRTLRPTEEGNITFIVSESGLPVIDAEFTFVTDHGTVTAGITGMRGVILPFMPDWNEAFKVSRFRKTVRVAALSTAEERAAMEARTLLRLSFSVLTMDATETVGLKRQALQVGSNIVGVPLWSEALRTSAAAAPAAILLPTEPTDGMRIEAGDLVLIWDDPRHWVLKTVQSVQASSIALAQTVGASFDTGAWVVPVLTGKLTSRPEFTQVTDEVARAQIDFEEQM